MNSPQRLADYVDKWASETPATEAIVFQDQRLTYAELARRVEDTAKAFLDAGLQHGDRVAMLAMACPEFLISFMAASKIGATWLGLNPKMPARELGYILADCRPKLLISLAEYQGKPLKEELERIDLADCGVQRVLVIGQPWPGSDCFADFTSRSLPQWDASLSARAAEVTAEHDALLMYTSGSTGRPKGVIQTHGSILANVEQQVKHFYVDGQTRALLHFPINHVAADVEIGYATLYAGGTIVMMDRFDPAESLAIIAREQITMFGQIPAMFLMQAALPNFAQTDFRSLKAIIWGGAAAPMKLLRGLGQISQATGAKLLTGYGSTEACGFITYSRPTDELEVLATSVGYPAEGFELRIVGDDRQPLPAGKVGELAIRGPFLFKEYLNQPEATAAAKDRDGWYYTGDLGYIDASGCLFLNGRKSEMFKTGGENVFPREIEDVLSEHPAVALAAVIGVPDPLYQEVGYALVMKRPGSPITAEELAAHCKAHLANFKVPKTYDIRDMLPLLPNGKVNKLELKRELAAVVRSDE